MNPGAREICDGIDNDCDGAIDEGDSLCPGGLCVAGTCRLDVWARTFASTEFATATGVAMDGEGNVYVSGTFTGSVDFGAGPIAAKGEQDPIIVSFDPSGLYRWHKTFDYEGADRANSIAVDAMGNVYVLVAWRGFDGPIDFGGGPMTETGDGHALVTLSARDGQYRRARQLARAGEYRLAGTSDGVVLAGSALQAFDYGAGELAAGSWLLRYLADGTVSWVRQLDDSESAGILGFTIRGDETMVGLAITVPIDLGGGTPLPVGSSGVAMALARYSAADGSHIWSTSYPSAGRALVFATALTGSGGACAAGWFEGELRLSPTVLRDSGDDRTGFVACFKADGEYDWDRIIQGDASWSVTGLASDSTGDLFMAGSYSGTVNLGGGVITASGSREGFVARYTPSGAHRWDEGFTTSDWSEVKGLAVGPGDSTVVVGDYRGSVDLAGRTRTSNGSTDVFVIRLQR